MENIYKTIRFDMVTIGSHFNCEDLQVGTEYVKVSARKARVQTERGATMLPEFAMKGSQRVQVRDVEKEKARAEEIAKPVFDGTRESCRNDREWFMLSEEFRSVRQAYEKLDEEAASVERVVTRVRQQLRHRFTFVEAKQRWDPTISATPAQLADHCSVNSLGELQGRSADFDRQCALVHEARNRALLVVRLLGYRLSADGKEPVQL